MAVMAGKIPGSPIATQRATISLSPKTADSAAKSASSNRSLPSTVGLNRPYLGSPRLLRRKFHSLNERFCCLLAKSWSPYGRQQSSVLCRSRRAQDTETKECSRPYADCSDDSQQDNLRYLSSGSLTQVFAICKWGNFILRHWHLFDLSISRDENIFDTGVVLILHHYDGTAHT